MINAAPFSVDLAPTVLMSSQFSGCVSRLKNAGGKLEVDTLCFLVIPIRGCHSRGRRGGTLEAPGNATGEAQDHSQGSRTTRPSQNNSNSYDRDEIFDCVSANDEDIIFIGG